MFEFNILNMIKGKLIHPELLSTLAKCGHKAKVLIADSNYSFETNSSPSSVKIYLNLTPGMIKGTDILEAVLTAINVEAAEVMETPSDFHPEIYDEFKELLPDEIELSRLERYTFYNKVCSKDCLLVIASGEQRRFANILLTVGVVK